MNLLIIDDIPAEHELCVAYLAAENPEYQFFHAYTGQQGIEIYHHETIDCVLLDYNLPDICGLEVLKRLSGEEKALPIIMMTGEGNEIIAVTAMKLGSQDYIPKKSVTSSALRRAVERAAERADLLRKMGHTRAELERSNHDLEQFANIVAHDLKSPLRAVTQHLTLIRNAAGGALDDKALRSLDFAVEGAGRMRALIDALFTYARIGFSEPSMDAVSLETVMEHVRQDLAAALGERRAVLTQDALPVVHGDAVLLTQLLQNLISNAVKYCRETPRIHVGVREDSHRITISVRDNGIGIPPEQHEKVFAIFRRLHEESEYPGIGLGLAICSRIVRQHGGRIWVESEEGKGSTFHFTLHAPMSAQEGKRAYG